MRVPLSWLRAWAALPDVGVEVAAALVRAGLEVEKVEPVGRDISAVVVGEVCSVEELTGFRKPIRFAQVSIGGPPRGLVCGATNFAAGDLVPVALPGARLPGVPFPITARETYGRLSEGMICSAAELGLGEDAGGILVLPTGLEPGTDLVAALALGDEVLDVTVTPDRGYCLSVRGLAREAATALGVAFRDPAVLDPPTAHGPAYDVRVEDPRGCDRYVARVVTGLDPDARSPLWLQRRLTLAGMRPISLPVDVTNHVLLELGQPLHAFDRARLRGPILVRRAAVGERLTTLDGAARVLDHADLVIADSSGPVALAGVMGGAGTEVTAATTGLVLESAHFDPASVARTGRRHRLSTEASRRYERGVDDDLPAVAAEAAVRLLTQLGGATAGPGVTDVDARVARPSISLPVGLPGRVAGTSIPAAVVRRRLKEVGCELSGGDPVQAHPPSWRPDLREPIDLVEEVVRLGGYDAIPSVLPLAPTGRGLTPAQRLRRRVGRALAAAGYVEVLTSPFLSDAVWDDFTLPADDPRRRTLRVVNPLAEDEAVLRTTLLPGLLAALARNAGRGADDLGLFEEGQVYRPGPAAPVAPAVSVDRRPEVEQLAALDAALPAQPLRLAVVLAGDREPGGWWGPGRPVSWADAVEAARTVAGAVPVELDVSADQHAPWHPGRCAALRVDGTLVGHAGELHPRVVAAMSLPAGTAAMELELDPLIAWAAVVVAAPSVSTYPVATVDVALLVAADVPAAAVERALREGAGPLLESVRLFDVYTGPQVGPGRRGLAYALRLRATDRTLAGDELAAVRDAAVAAAGRATGAVLRGP
ncbi:MAG: phenylalanine--tRNA ligase subunit beta [Mycobacteriales bacterium]